MQVGSVAFITPPSEAWGPQSSLDAKFMRGGGYL